MTAEELAAIEARLNRGPTTLGVTMSPWAEQLVKDAYALLREVQSFQAERMAVKQPTIKDECSDDWVWGS